MEDKIYKRLTAIGNQEMANYFQKVVLEKEQLEKKLTKLEKFISELKKILKTKISSVRKEEEIFKKLMELD